MKHQSSFALNGRLYLHVEVSVCKIRSGNAKLSLKEFTTVKIKYTIYREPLTTFLSEGILLANSHFLG